MAAIETNTRSSVHIRCNSLPSAPHPLVSQLNERLHRLKDSEATTSLSSSSSSISHKLNGLQDLHDCVDNLLQLPATQQALRRGCSDKSVDDLLNGSLRLLDISSLAKDCLLQSKESMQEIQSVIRRRRVADTGFIVEVGKCLASRKKINKAIQKALGNLNGIKNEFMVSSSNKDNETLSMLSILKEAAVVTLSSLESLLLFISYPKGRSKQRRWSIISKLVQLQGEACDSEESNTNEFERVDAALQYLSSHKASSIQNLQTNVETLEMCIQDLEVGVEHLSRQLIRTRVSLLNIFNH